MQAEMLRWLVLAIGTPALAGCQQSQSAAAKITPAPPAQPFVFYDRTGDPSRESPAILESDLRAVRARVATQTSDPIWLVRVRSSYANGVYFSAVADVMPDETSPRVRVGRAYDIRVSRGKLRTFSPQKYAQVSLLGHSFGEQLTKPSVTEMPFFLPEAVDSKVRENPLISREEVVTVIDFVRQPSAYRDLPVQDESLKDSVVRSALELPLFDMSKEGDKINVRFGYVSGFSSWRYGLTVTLECTWGGHKITDWRLWEE